MSSKSRIARAGRPCVWVVAAGLAALSVRPALGDVNAGDVVTAAKLEQVKDLISPGIEWCVRHGLGMRIVDPKRVDWPKAYREATEKYSPQVKIGADGINLENYVAGRPFPTIDASDPQVAIKIMWNYEFKPLISDDVAIKNFDADTGTIHGGTTPMKVERHFLLDSARRLRYVGRLYNDPKPLWKTDEGFHAKAALYPILEPFDLKGVGGLSYRYIDRSRQDDTFLYLPSLRRVRRLSSAQRSDALFGQDTDVDSYYGYDGHIAWMDWKYLGEKEMLGAFHAENFPVKWNSGGADFVFDDVWEKRKVHVIEGISKLAQYAYSKRVLFIDQETSTVLYSDIYDRAGQLWKVWINLFSYRKQPFAGAKLSVYEDERGFLPAIVMVDMQLSHATKAALPSHRYPGEEGWYFNLGERLGVNEEFFHVGSLIEAGR